MQERSTTPEELIAYGGTAVFVTVYVWAILVDLVLRTRARPAPAAVLLGLLGVVVALSQREANWTVLFIAAGTVAGRISPSRAALTAIVVIAMLAILARLASAATAVGILETAFEVVLTGLVVLAFSQLERTARALSQAQAEVARLAAADERARIARDVHDLLGHSLSVIALKSELARRLVEGDPRRASAELRDIEGVARGSLRDIRETVAGYRRITLDTELTGARVALSAAGMVVDVPQPPGILDEAADALLGWIVREGVTNVVRHSGGAHCTIRIETIAQEVRLEIVDDGQGNDRRGPGAPGPSGSGLPGIRERVEAVGGRVEAGPLPGGGYRLAAFVPDGTGAPPRLPASPERDQHEPGRTVRGRDEDVNPATSTELSTSGGPS
ncbi:MAG: sensor histidine kinase [Candidatus Limnocylindrales bacterium]